MDNFEKVIPPTPASTGEKWGSVTKGMGAREGLCFLRLEKLENVDRKDVKRGKLRCNAISSS